MTADQLNRIEERLEELASGEDRLNGHKLWLWVVNGIVLPALAYCLFNVVQISGNRYTSGDAVEHNKEHVQLIREIAIMKAKLAGLPPKQIEENRGDIKKLNELWNQHIRDKDHDP